MVLNVGTCVFMYERAAFHVSHDYLNTTFNFLLHLPTDSQTTTQQRARDTVLLLLRGGSAAASTTGLIAKVIVNLVDWVLTYFLKGSLFIKRVLIATL